MSDEIDRPGSSGPNPYAPNPYTPTANQTPEAEVPVVRARKRGHGPPNSSEQILIKLLLTGIIVVPLIAVAIALFFGLPFHSMFR